MAANRSRGASGRRERDPDGVIANRVIADIIQNASAEFRDYLQRAGTMEAGWTNVPPLPPGWTPPGQGGAVPMAAGGGSLPPGVQGPPGPAGSWVNPYDPNAPQPPFAGMPMQGPWPTPLIDPMRPRSDRFHPYLSEIPQNPMPMPPVIAPDIAMPMPNMGPTTYEDGSTSVPYPQPWDRNIPMMTPHSLSMPDLLRLLGMA